MDQIKPPQNYEINEDLFNDDEYLIEQFVLDEKSEPEALEVVRKGFVNVYSDEGGTTEFHKKMFNILFNSPYIPRNFFVRAVYKPTNKMVGFLGGIPRDVYYQGRVYKCGFPSFLAVDPEHRQKKLAYKMGLKMLELGLKLGFEAGLAFYEPEEHGIDTGKALSRDTGIPFVVLKEIDKFLIRIFDVNEASKVIKLKWFEKLGLKLFQPLKKVKSKRVRKYRSSDGEHLYNLLEDFKTHNEMSFLRDKEDFLWYFDQPGLNCVVHENESGEIDGFMAAFEFLLSGFGNSIKLGWVDIIHTYRLNQKESAELAKYFAQVSKEMGWIGLQSPYIPYFDPKPFKKANFLFFPKKLMVVICPLKEIEIKIPLKSFYFDWR